MENFVGSRKVAHIQKVWSLLSTKIPISSKSVENSSVMSHSPAAPPVFTNSAQFFRITFQFIKRFRYFWKAGIVTFQKSNICLNKYLETSELFEKSRFNSSNFQQISALEPILAMKFHKFCAVILVVESTTNNDSKTLSCIKIGPQELKISLIEDQKTCEID